MAFDRVIIKNFGCIKELDFELTPLHALIGPNDSGKSTILRAVRIALQLAAASFQRPAGGNELYPFEPRQLGEQSGALVTLGCGALRYEVGNAQNRIQERLLRGTEELATGDRGDWTEHGVLQRFVAQNAIRVDDRADGATAPAIEADLRSFLVSFIRRRPRMVRLDPDALRQASQTQQTGFPIDFSSERGQGLGVVLDAIRDRDDGGFDAIRADFRKVFPTVRRLQLQVTDPGTKTVAIELTNGVTVSADRMSEGMLYYLALSALRHLEPASMVLVEEPENGLYVSRIKGVVEALRETSKSSPVLIATHSPLVVNELAPDEVSLVTRDPEHGTKVVRLSDTKDFAERSRIYANGELWLSHADGDQEKDLVKQVGE